MSSGMFDLHSWSAKSDKLKVLLPAAYNQNIVNILGPSNHGCIVTSAKALCPKPQP